MIEATRGIDTQLIDPVAMTAAETASGNLDCAGADWATIRVAFAAEINTNAVGPTLVLNHGDTTSSYTALSTRATEDITAAKEVRYEVDLLGKKRYLNLAITTATHTTNDLATVSAIATLHRNDADPASTTAMGDDVVVEA